jgi:hypothetical protein
LDGFRKAIKQTDDWAQTEAKYYLIQFDNRTKFVTATPYDSIIMGSTAYDTEESKSDPQNAVLVEVDKIEDLKDAYPNYFLDVGLFTKGLKNVLAGQEFGLISEPTHAVQSAWHYDFAAILRDWRQRRR